MQWRSPVVVHRRKRPPRRTVLAAGGAVVALLGAVAWLAASVLTLVAALLVAVATGVLALVTPPDEPTPRKLAGGKPAPESGLCGAPTADGTPCRRSVLTRPCPVPGHAAKGRKPGS